MTIEVQALVQNYIELLVEDTLKKELADNGYKYDGLCTCPSCMAFIKATALNLLPPFYITSTAGGVYGESRAKENQNLSDVLVAVTKGIETARRDGHRPNH